MRISLSYGERECGVSAAVSGTLRYRTCDLRGLTVLGENLPALFILWSLLHGEALQFDGSARLLKLHVSNRLSFCDLSVKLGCRC